MESKLRYVVKKIRGNGTPENPLIVKYWTGKKWVKNTDSEPAKGYKIRKAAENVLIKEKQICGVHDRIVIQGY